MWIDKELISSADLGGSSNDSNELFQLPLKTEVGKGSIGNAMYYGLVDPNC